MEDIIIRNGLIVDVENEKIAKGDISVKDGKIVKVCSYIEEHATSEIDADGCYVTPGLIDHHTHIYPLAAIGTAGEAVCFGSGVTTAVDAGSTGCDNYEQYRGWIGMEKLSIMPYINVAVWVYLHFQSRWKMLNQSTWMWENSKNYLTSTEMNCLA